MLLNNKCNQKSKSDKSEVENKAALQLLYDQYKDGEIEQCTYNGELVFIAGLNAPDAGSVIYNKDGFKIGSCNYGWGKPDSMCLELKDCIDIYRVQNNIWGKPFVDKYNLGSDTN